MTQENDPTSSSVPWELDTDRDDKCQLLTNKDLTQWESGDPTGHYKRSIKSKAMYAATLVHSLIKDISLWAYYDMLPPGDALWEELVDIESCARQLVDRQVTFVGDEEANRELQFGYELGCVIALLLSMAANADRPAQRRLEVNITGKPWMDIIRGFALAFIGDQAADLSEERECWYEFIKYVNKYEGNRLTTLANIETFEDRIVNRTQQYNRQTTKRLIIKRLKEHDIIPVDWLVEFIQEEIYEETMLLSIDEQVTEEIERIIDRIGLTQLQKRSRLQRAIEQDIETLRNRKESSWQGVDPLQILELLWRHRSPESGRSKQLGRAQLSEELPLPEQERFSFNRDKIVGALRKMADGSDEKWNDYPVVYSRSNEWWLTDYGAVLCFYLFSINEQPMSLYISEVLLKDIEKREDNPWRYNREAVDDQVEAMGKLITKVVEKLELETVQPESQ